MKKYHTRVAPKNILFFLTLLSLLFLETMFIHQGEKKSIVSASPIASYFSRSVLAKTNISYLETVPKQISFSETKNIVHFNALYPQLKPSHLCALESVLKTLEKESEIFIWVADFLHIKSPFYQELLENLKRSNELSAKVTVNIIKVNFEVILADTPLENLFKATIEFFKGDRKKAPRLSEVNLADGFRLAVLYKYGGVYLDLDMLAFQDPTRLEDGIAKADDGRLNNAFLKFTGKNRKVLFAVMEEFKSGFSSKVWGDQGPALWTRFFGGEEKLEENIKGKGLSLVAEEDVYPFGYEERHEFLKSFSEFQDYRLGFQEIFGKDLTLMHLWHHRTGPYEVRACKQGIEAYKDSYLGGLRNEVCPNSFKLMETSQLSCCCDTLK
eukprot:snap_masked-scaffold_29-processed-gene-0.41-mRNA-1 protein AED:1.00 eAED:1.00 QI:0/-1/0/0/-1/1/1/0/382